MLVAWIKRFVPQCVFRLCYALRNSGQLYIKEAEEIQGVLEDLLSKFQDNVRLLHNYGSKTISNGTSSSMIGSGEITPTEFRVLENTKVFFKRELRDAVVTFQKYKQSMSQHI